MSIKRILSVFGLIFICLSCVVAERDFSEIADENVLHVAVGYNSVDSLPYDLCRYIEMRSGWQVEILPEDNLELGIHHLKKNIYDVLALNIPVTKESKREVALTIPLAQSKWVLVQRIPKEADTIPLIRNQMDLAHRTVFITKNSSAVLRLTHLSEEIAEPITIQEVENCTQEQLMNLVAKRYVDYAIVDQVIALHYAASFLELDAATDIGFLQWQAWAVRKNSPVLLDSLDVWIKEYQLKNK